MKRLFHLFPVVLASIFLAGSASSAVVNVCDEASLRAALVGGGTITFGCDGTITLTNTLVISSDTVLDATGRNVTLSGGGSNRVLTINTGVTFTATNLIIANGRSTNGAGIFNEGNLRLINCQVISNHSSFAITNAKPFCGGGVYTRIGTLTASNTSFVLNRASGTDTNGTKPGAEARGGALYVESGLAQIQSCYFSNNSAGGGNGLVPSSLYSFPGRAGSGGAIYSLGTIDMSSCWFAGNSATGGLGGASNDLYIPGSAGGEGSGGAIYNAGTFRCEQSTFESQQAIGGNGGTGRTGYGGPDPVFPGLPGGAANGGAIYNSGGMALASVSLYVNSTRGGTGGNGAPGAQNANPGVPPGQGSLGGTGASARGGGIFNNGTLTMTNCTSVGNMVTGGNGGPGGNGGLASLAPFSVGANGGNGGPGGSASGGGLYSTNNSALLVNCTFASHVLQGGTGGALGFRSCGRAMPCTSGNGVAGANGSAEGGAISSEVPVNGGVQMVNTLLGANFGAANGFGTITDLGNNLSSDATPGFTSAASRNLLNPRIGPFANNGGTVWTMAIQSNSPAIDAGNDAASPPTDSRGMARPLSAGSDIGSFEWVPNSFRFTRMTRQENGTLRFQGSGIANSNFRVEWSTNLSNWYPFGGSTASAQGATSVDVPLDTAQVGRFYRMVSP